MGAAERANQAQRAAEAVALSGCMLVLDVQHLYRDAPHAGDRGARFTLGDGTHVWEAAAATLYASAAAAWLRAHGATVYTNDPVLGTLVGPYSRRQAAANALGVHAYIACHVNAGGGSYARAEYMVGSPGQRLGYIIGTAITKTFREVRTCQCMPLVAGQRGAVCVAGVDRRVPAIVLEPFFGDNTRHQAIFEPPYLAALGVAIGVGVATWWQVASSAASGAAASRR